MATSKRALAIGADSIAANRSASDIYHQSCLKRLIFPLQFPRRPRRQPIPRIPPQICHHPRPCHLIIKTIMHMPVNPQVCLLNQRRQVAGKPGIEQRTSVTRMNGLRMRRVVRDDDGRADILLPQLRLQPAARLPVELQCILRAEQSLPGMDGTMIGEIALVFVDRRQARLSIGRVSLDCREHSVAPPDPCPIPRRNQPCRCTYPQNVGIRHMRG